MEGIPDIESFRQRVAELDALMAAPDFFQDGRRAAELGREHQKLARLIGQYEELERLEGEIAEHRAIADEAEGDPELAALAAEELPGLEARFEAVRSDVLLSMIPPDPSDSRNTVMEIRAGVGGDEASLFAADLFRMYNRFAEQNNFKVEMLGASPSDAGGFKEVSFLISGEDVYRRLKFESGAHRVQRIPVTETNGRIHTSAVTVAVLPEAEEVDVEIDPNDLDITATRASGAGGQHVNTTDSAIQMVHKPTGLTVYCADERSQLKNKTKALKVLRARLLKLRREEEEAKYAENRRAQVGTGDRSERIRTYNFPQSRLTDHRIGLTVHSLPEAMDGDIDHILVALERADQQRRLQALADEAAARRGD